MLHESKTHQWAFYTFFNKSLLGLCYTGNGSFTHKWFHNLMCSHLENIVFTELCRPSKFWHILLCGTKKSYLSILPPVSSANLFKTGNYQAYQGQYKFLKILMLQGSSILSLATNIATCFSWTVRFTLFVFQENGFQIPKSE